MLVKRLVRARHPKLGISAAGSVPGEEFRNIHLAVDCHTGCFGAVSRACPAAALGRSATAGVSADACQRRLSNHPRGLAPFRENASPHAPKPERFRVLVLDARPDDRTS